MSLPVFPEGFVATPRTEMPWNSTSAGAMETVAAPFDIRGADIAVRGPAPALGQHTREVLEEAGISAERLDDLEARGVVVSR